MGGVSPACCTSNAVPTAPCMSGAEASCKKKVVRVDCLKPDDNDPEWRPDMELFLQVNNDTVMAPDVIAEPTCSVSQPHGPRSTASLPRNYVTPTPAHESDRTEAPESSSHDTLSREEDERWYASARAEQGCISECSVQLARAWRYSSARRLEVEFAVTPLRVGEGKSGLVHFAMHRLTGAPFAVKSLRKTAALVDLRTEFQNEMETYLALDHPHIATLHQVFESSADLHLVMEYLDGGDLWTAVQTEGRFTEDRAAKATRQMCLAVSYMHGERIVHRDLKPQHFIYVAATEHLKLIDFGFATRIGANEKLSQACGTRTFAAPEVFLRWYTEKADVWSLGVVAAVLLCGGLPWRGADVMEAALRSTPLSYQHLTATLSDEARQFLSVLLVQDPGRRSSAARALSHPWHRDSFVDVGPPDSVLFRNMRRFSAADPLRRAFLLLAAWAVPRIHDPHLQDQFWAMGAGRTGTITADDFERALGVCGADRLCDSAEARRLFQALPLGDRGELPFRGFLAAALQASSALMEKALEGVLMLADADLDGEICMADMRRVLSSSFEGRTLEDLVSTAGSDGKISLVELRALLMSGNN